MNRIEPCPEQPWRDEEGCTHPDDIHRCKRAASDKHQSMYRNGDRKIHECECGALAIEDAAA